MLFLYFITFIPKCFALTVAAVSGEARAIIAEQNVLNLYNSCAAMLILRMTANSAQNFVHAESQNSDVPSIKCWTTLQFLPVNHAGWFQFCVFFGLFSS